MHPGEPEREPFAITRLWSSGNLIYGDPDNPASDHLRRCPSTAPEQATWAKVRTFSTGHGFYNTDNAAEFSYKWQRLPWTMIRNSTTCGGRTASTTVQPPAGHLAVRSRRLVPRRQGRSLGRGHQQLDHARGNRRLFASTCSPTRTGAVPTIPIAWTGQLHLRGPRLLQVRMAQVVFYRQITTDVQGGRPQEAVLHLVGNHPNPFNPRTMVQYHLARPGTIVLSIFDAEGNRVRSVERHHAQAGLQAWTWQGRDDAGRGVPSGLYMYEVRLGSERVSGKMLLLR